MRRVFILKSSEGRTAPDFSLKSLSAWRMDLIARCIIASFATPMGPRREAVLHVVLEGPPNPPITVSINGEELEKMPISEIKAAEILYNALLGRPDKGVYIEKKSFERILLENSNNEIFYLHELGEDFEKVKMLKTPVFVLGDHKGIDEEGERVLEKIGAKKISLGRIPYLASHCIIIVNNELDNRWENGS